MRSTALVMCGVVAVLVTIAAGDVLRGDAPREDGRHRVTGKIPFVYSFEDAASRAAADGRPIFAYFTFET